MIGMRSRNMNVLNSRNSCIKSLSVMSRIRIIGVFYFLSILGGRVVAPYATYRDHLFHEIFRVQVICWFRYERDEHSLCSTNVFISHITFIEAQHTDDEESCTPCEHYQGADQHSADRLPI